MANLGGKDDELGDLLYDDLATSPNGSPVVAGAPSAGNPNAGTGYQILVHPPQTNFLPTDDGVTAVTQDAKQTNTNFIPTDDGVTSITKDAKETKNTPPAAMMLNDEEVPFWHAPETHSTRRKSLTPNFKFKPSSDLTNRVAAKSPTVTDSKTQKLAVPLPPAPPRMPLDPKPRRSSFSAGIFHKNVRITCLPDDLSRPVIPPLFLERRRRTHADFKEEEMKSQAEMLALGVDMQQAAIHTVKKLPLPGQNPNSSLFQAAWIRKTLEGDSKVPDGARRVAFEAVKEVLGVNLKFLLLPSQPWNELYKVNDYKYYVHSKVVRGKFPTFFDHNEDQLIDFIASGKFRGFGRLLVFSKWILQIDLKSHNLKIVRDQKGNYWLSNFDAGCTFKKGGYVFDATNNGTPSFTECYNITAKGCSLDPCFEDNEYAFYNLLCLIMAGRPGNPAHFKKLRESEAVGFDYFYGMLFVMLCPKPILKLFCACLTSDWKMQQYICNLLEEGQEAYKVAAANTVRCIGNGKYLEYRDYIRSPLAREHFLEIKEGFKLLRPDEEQSATSAELSDFNPDKLDGEFEDLIKDITTAPRSGINYHEQPNPVQSNTVRQTNRCLVQ